MKSVYDFLKIAYSLNIDRYMANAYDFAAFDKMDICRNVAAGLKGEGYTEQDFLGWMDHQEMPELPEGNSAAWSKADPVPGCEILKYANMLDGDELIQCRAYKLDLLLRDLYQGEEVKILDLIKAYDAEEFSDSAKNFLHWLFDSATHAKKNEEEYYKAMYRDLLFFTLARLAHYGFTNRSDWLFLDDNMPGEPVIQ